MAALDRLVAVVPPRASAHRATADDAEIVRAFGTTVPSDYLSLVEAYGPGSFCGLLTLLAPSPQGRGLVDIVEETLADIRSLEYPLPGLPAQPYLPCAFFIDGDEVYWQCQGPADAWPVWLVSPGGADAELAAASLTEFILKWVDGSLVGRIASSLPDAGERPERFFETALSREVVELRLPYEASVEAIRSALESAFDDIVCRYTVPESAPGRCDGQAYFDAADGRILLYFRAVRSGGSITCQVPAPLLEATRARLNAAVLAQS